MSSQQMAAVHGVDMTEEEGQGLWSHLDKESDSLGQKFVPGTKLFHILFLYLYFILYTPMLICVFFSFHHFSSILLTKIQRLSKF